MKKGEVITSRKGIANVFGEFYSKLYDDDQHDDTELESGKMRLKTTQEIKVPMWKRRNKFQNSRLKSCRAAINRLEKRDEAGDSNWIRAEDIKVCHEETKEMVRQIFNEVIKQKKCTPEEWQEWE